MSQSWEKVKPSATEMFHHYLLQEFHKFRKENNNNPKQLTIELDGIEFSEIVVSAKKRVYEEYPEAKENVPKKP